ncbi:dihydrofolate reductase family protein [Clostridium polynesiense]|uniref:dihydrofolate reductase family protein n=1 Tax=Clostridium polynesiense TaxID=1325933 RepID=UPI00058DC856|nr:dihydrofolate reductase family protein [Clostridium polynesiense]
MKRKIILNLAMSLDGYIASEDDGYSWITEDNGASRDFCNEKAFDFQGFFDSTGIVVMGRNCYDLGMHKEFKNQKIYVATSRKDEDYENIHFISGDICKTILEEKEKEGKDIYLFGGGKLVDSFIKADIIDEYIIGIIPIILGSGKPLFFKDNPSVRLKLVENTVDNGIVILRYVKR